jgi:serine/threonine protein kinase
MGRKPRQGAINWLRRKVSSVLGRGRTAPVPIPETSGSEELRKSHEDKYCTASGDPEHLQSPTQTVCDGEIQQQNRPEVVPVSSLPSGPLPLLSNASESKVWCDSENGTLQDCAHTTHKKCLHPDSCFINCSFGAFSLPPPPYFPEENLFFDIPSKHVLEGVSLSTQSLGVGSYGTVVLASYRSTPVAAKSLHSILKQSAHYSWQHGNEIETLSEIRHPNIVQFLGTHKDESGSVYLIMEHVEGGSVSELVGFLQAGKRKVSLHQKMGIFIGIGRALEYLHSIPLVHRDLSSSNVLLTKELQVKVSDFGMCRPLPTQPLNLAPGCYLYMPPEALKPGGLFKEKGDIFSLSVIIMELINQAHPRVLNMEGSEYDRRMQDVRDFGSKAPRDLHGLVIDCLHEVPEKRPSARDINCELEELLKSLPEEKVTLALQSPKLYPRESHQESGSWQALSPFVSSEGLRSTTKVCPAPHSESEEWGEASLVSLEQSDRDYACGLVLAQPTVLETSHVERSEMVSGGFARCFEARPMTLNCDANAAQADDPNFSGDTQDMSNQPLPKNASNLDENHLSSIPTSPSNASFSPSTVIVQQYTLVYRCLPHDIEEAQCGSREEASEDISDSATSTPDAQHDCHTEIVLKHLSNLVLQNTSELLNPHSCTSMYPLYWRKCRYIVILARFLIPCGYIDIVVIICNNTMILFAIRITLVTLVIEVESYLQNTPQQMIQSATTTVVALSRYSHMRSVVCLVSHCLCRSVSQHGPHPPSLLNLTNGGHCVYTIFLSRTRLSCGYLDVVVILKGNTVVLFAVRILFVEHIIMMLVESSQLKVLQQNPSQRIVPATKVLVPSNDIQRHNYSAVYAFILKILTHVFHCLHSAMSKHEAMSTPSQRRLPSTKALLVKNQIHVYSAIRARIFRMLSRVFAYDRNAVSQRAILTSALVLQSSSCIFPAVEFSTTAAHHSCKQDNPSNDEYTYSAICVFFDIMFTQEGRSLIFSSVGESHKETTYKWKSTVTTLNGAIVPSSSNHVLSTACACIFQMFYTCFYNRVPSKCGTIALPTPTSALLPSLPPVESSAIVKTSSHHSTCIRSGPHYTYTALPGTVKVYSVHLDVVENTMVTPIALITLMCVVDSTLPTGVTQKSSQCIVPATKASVLSRDNKSLMYSPVGAFIVNTVVSDVLSSQNDLASPARALERQSSSCVIPAVDSPTGIVPHSCNNNSLSISNGDYPVFLRWSCWLQGKTKVTPIALAMPVKSPQLTQNNSRCIVPATNSILSRDSLSLMYWVVHTCSFSNALSSQHETIALPNPAPTLQLHSSSSVIPTVDSSATTVAPQSCNHKNLPVSKNDNSTYPVFIKRSCGYIDTMVMLRRNAAITPITLVMLLKSCQLKAIAPKDSQCFSPATNMHSSDSQRCMYSLVHSWIFSMVSHVFHCFSSIQLSHIETSALRSPVPHSSNLSSSKGIYTVIIRQSCGYIDMQRVALPTLGSFLVRLNSVVESNEPKATQTTSRWIVAATKSAGVHYSDKQGHVYSVNACLFRLLCRVFHSESDIAIALHICSSTSLLRGSIFQQCSSLPVCAHIVVTGRSARHTLGTVYAFTTATPSLRVATTPATSPLTQAARQSPMPPDTLNSFVSGTIPTSIISESNWHASSASYNLPAMSAMMIRTPRTLVDPSKSKGLVLCSFLDLHSRTVLVCTASDSLCGHYSRMQLPRNTSTSHIPAPASLKATIPPKPLRCTIHCTPTKSNLPTGKPPPIVVQTVLLKPSALDVKDTSTAKEHSWAVSSIKDEAKCVQVQLLPGAKETLIFDTIAAPQSVDGQFLNKVLHLPEQQTRWSKRVLLFRALCHIQHSVDMHRATSLNKKNTMPQMKQISVFNANRGPTYGQISLEFLSYLYCQVHTFLNLATFDLLSQEFEPFMTGLAIMCEQHPDTVARRNTVVVHVLKHEPFCHEFRPAAKLRERCAMNSHDAVIYVTTWSVELPSSDPALRVSITILPNANNTTTNTCIYKDSRTTSYCHEAAIAWVYQSLHSTPEPNAKIIDGLSSTVFHVGNKALPRFGFASCHTSPELDLCLQDVRAATVCRFAGSVPNHLSHMTFPWSALFKLSSLTSEFNPSPCSYLFSQPVGSFCSMQACPSTGHSFLTGENVQRKLKKKKRDECARDQEEGQRKRNSSQLCKRASAGTDGSEYYDGPRRIMWSSQQERCPSRKPSRRKKQRKKQSACLKTQSFWADLIYWCTLLGYRFLLQLHASCRKRSKHVTLRFYGRGESRIKKYPHLAKPCPLPWNIGRTRETKLAPNNPLPFPTRWGTALPLAFSVRKQAGWICQQALFEAAYMHQEVEDVCKVSAADLLISLHALVSLLPLLGASRPRPACLVLDLNQPVRVVCSPESGSSTTTTGGGSGNSGREGDKGTSDSGSNESPSGGAGHTSPGGGGKREDDENNDEKNFKGKKDTESDDKEDEMEENEKEEGESGANRTEDSKTKENAEKECVPVCAFSEDQKNEIQRKGGDILTPQNSPVVQRKKKTPHPHKDTEKQGHENVLPLVQLKVPVQTDSGKALHKGAIATKDQTEDKIDDDKTALPTNNETKEDKSSPDADAITTEDQPEDELAPHPACNDAKTSNSGLGNPIKSFISFAGETESGFVKKTLIPQEYSCNSPTELGAQTEDNGAQPHTEPPLADESVLQHKLFAPIQAQESEYNETGTNLPISTTADTYQRYYEVANDDILLSENNSFEISYPLLNNSAVVTYDHPFEWHCAYPPPASIPLFPLSRITRERRSSSSSNESQEGPGDDSASKEEECRNGDSSQTNLGDGTGDHWCEAVEEYFFEIYGLPVTGQCHSQESSEVVEEVIEENDEDESRPSLALLHLDPVVTHNNTTATICILTHEDTKHMTPHESRDRDEGPYSRMPSFAEPETVESNVTPNFDIMAPMDESPFLPRLYEELRDNGVRPIFCRDELPQVQGIPLEQYLEHAFQNGNFLFAVEVLHHLINCMRICALWGTPFSLHAEDVYVDIGTRQLEINATTCIASHSQDAGQDCMEASVGRLRVMLRRLLFILQDNNPTTNEQVTLGIHLVRNMIEICWISNMEDIIDRLLAEVQQYM